MAGVVDRALSVLFHPCAFVVLVSILGTSAQYGTGHSADKVKVTVYYESLCGSSRVFITRQLYPTWQQLADIMEVDLNAYGKSHEINETTHECQCQHGPSECEGNVLLTCAKKYLTDFDEFLEFTNCIMDRAVADKAGADCAEQAGVDYTVIETCSTGEEGKLLIHDVGVEQSTLDPPLNYVPWILINEVYETETHRQSERDLKEVICSTYEGPKPTACLL